MNKYKIRIENPDGSLNNGSVSFKAESMQVLAEKLKALRAVDQILTHDQLMSAMDLIVSKPKLVPWLQDKIDEIEDLSQVQLGLKAPKIIKELMNILEE